MLYQKAFARIVLFEVSLFYGAGRPSNCKPSSIACCFYIFKTQRNQGGTSFLSNHLLVKKKCGVNIDCTKWKTIIPCVVYRYSLDHEKY